MYSYLQYLDNNLCTVTGSICKVLHVQLPAVSGQYLMYSYRHYLVSTLCTVTGSIWTVPSVQLPAVSGE